MLPDVPPIDEFTDNNTYYVPRAIFSTIETIVGSSTQVDEKLIAAVTLALSQSGIEDIEKIICKIIGSSSDRCITNLSTLVGAYINGKLFAQEENGDEVFEGQSDTSDLFDSSSDELFEGQSDISDLFDSSSDKFSGGQPDNHNFLNGREDESLQEEDQRWKITRVGSWVWGHTGGAIISGGGQVWDSTIRRFTSKKTIDDAFVDTAFLEHSAKESDDSFITVYKDDNSTKSIQSSHWSWIPFVDGRSQPTTEDLAKALTNALDSLNRGGGWLIGRLNSGVSALTRDIREGKFDRILSLDINTETLDRQIPLTTGVLNLALNLDRFELVIATMNRLNALSGDDGSKSDSSTTELVFDDEGYYELIGAISDANFTRVWRCIIDLNSNINYRNYRSREGLTALEIALKKYQNLEEGEENKKTREDLFNIIKLLLLQGVEPSGYTISITRNIFALHPYLEYQRINYAPSWKKETGTNPKIDCNNLAIILEIAENGDTFMARYIAPLLSSDNINYQNESGRTPLSLAAENNHLETLNVLVGVEGINPNLADSNGVSPLTYAITNNLPNIVQRLLLLEGINVNATDTNSNTPLHHAILAGNQLQNELSNSSNRRERNRISRAINDNERILEMLLRAPGIEIDQVNSEQHTPLSLAALSGLRNLSLRLMHYGNANIDISVNDQTIVEMINSTIESLDEQISNKKESKKEEDKKKVKELVVKRSGLIDILKLIKSVKENRSLEKEMDKLSLNPLSLVYKGKGNNSSEEDL